MNIERYMHRYLKLVLILLLFAILPNCVEKDFNPDDPKESFAIAKEPYDDQHYEIAVSKLSEFRARFPYSQFAVEAELLLANSQYELGKYPEAAVAYEQFARLHPKHAQADFALYRVGECYWLEAPEEIDREQEYTAKAVQEWEKLVKNFPASQHTGKAKENIAVGKRRIAESEVFVAKFYCKQEIFDSCAYRFIKILDAVEAYPDLQLLALEKGAFALDKVADDKEKNPESDKNIFHKKMSATDLRAKANDMRSLIPKIKSRNS